MIPHPVLVLLSGGIDSVTALYETTNAGLPAHCLFFDYGQKHIKERDFAKHHSDRLGLKLTILTLPQIPGSKLTDGQGSYVVPGRNAIFLSVAASMASLVGAQNLVIGCNADDHQMFSDCRKDFLEAMEEVFHVSGLSVGIISPNLRRTKRQVIARARFLDVDLSKTWSCYEGGESACGMCPACIQIPA